MTKEQKFLAALRDVFVGAKVEGESGYINLMRIKARYYEKGVFPKLQQDVNEALKVFPAFRDELFEKLYDFFHRYFSESGSIYFCYTPLHQNVYEKVYTDDKDVMLFWKTHMLYYVKTDRLFKSMEVELDGHKFFFDVSTLEHKKANEKRDIVYSLLKEKRKDTVVFTVTYSEKGKKTKTDDILKALRKNGDKITEDVLERVFRIFEKQSEVDYFINKDAKAFLEEQFNLWLYQYMFSGVSEWTEARIKQLQTLKDIALKIIAFISQFENELVKIWNKPKFVRNSNYIITLDRIAEKGVGLVEKLLTHKNFKVQAEEWQELGIVDSRFKKADVLEKNEKGKSLAKPYQHLPIDTKHFKELELEILGLFDDLDTALDGWLIKSENYQALNTFLPKFGERVKCIHIDPPYNTDTSGFLYKNAYQHSSWLTMMDNRIRASAPLLSSDGALLCHIDENECERLQLLCTETGISDSGTIVWDKKNPMLGREGIATQHEYVLWRTRRKSPVYLTPTNVLMITAEAESIIKRHGGVTSEARKEFADWIGNCKGLSGGDKAYRLIDDDGQVYRGVAMGAPEPRSDPKFHIPLVHPVTKKKCPVPPNGWSRAPETLRDLMEKGEILFGKDETVQPQKKVLLTQDSNANCRRSSAMHPEAKLTSRSLV
jgi:adenine-specific DNA-methyltransferase